MATIGASEFDTATAMNVDASGVWHGSLHDGWDIGGNANGGYTLACAMRALVGASGRPHPITMTAHYLAPGRPGPISIAPEVVKSGKRFCTVTGALVNGEGRELIRVLASCGDVLGGGQDVEHHDVSAPTADAFEVCAERAPNNGEVTVGLMNHVDVRLDHRSVGFQTGVRSGRAEMLGWFAFRDGRPVDPLALVLACDTFPPAVFHLDLPAGWVPTLELTVHVRDVPAPGPLLCRFRTRHVSNGLFEEDGEVWDTTGRLVALSRQMALMARAS